MNNPPNQTFQSLCAAVSDINGQARGKRYPADAMDKVGRAGIRMPLSALNLDIRGNDIEDSPLVFESGDQDGVMRPTERGLVPMPWLETPTAFLPLWAFDDNGAPFAGDPRQALARVLEKYSEQGWSPVCATELEFYLVRVENGDLVPAPSPKTGRPASGGEILSIRAIDDFEVYLSDLFAACRTMDIAIEAAISESGHGQFEVNLRHGPAMRMADDTYLFKMLATGLARSHGFAASFMAKPFPDQAGTGMHVHCSIMDKSGRNIFDDGSDGSPLLRHAIAGCLDALADSTLIFAPHGNSYARFATASHAPTGVAWAYENRTAAIRVPGGDPAARRLEHRVAGGDTNPYLALAAILGSALGGIEDGVEPPSPISGNAYALELPQIHADWGDAIAAADGSESLRRFLPETLIQSLVMTKRQELRSLAELSRADQLALYLDSV